MTAHTRKSEGRTKRENFCRAGRDATEKFVAFRDSAEVESCWTVDIQLLECGFHGRWLFVAADLILRRTTTRRKCHAFETQWQPAQIHVVSILQSRDYLKNSVYFFVANDATSNLNLGRYLVPRTKN
jgi:hypothetical protein